MENNRQTLLDRPNASKTAEHPGPTTPMLYTCIYLRKACRPSLL